MLWATFWIKRIRFRTSHLRYSTEIQRLKNLAKKRSPDGARQMYEMCDVSESESLPRVVPVALHYGEDSSDSGEKKKRRLDSSDRQDSSDSEDSSESQRAISESKSNRGKTSTHTQAEQSCEHSASEEESDSGSHQSGCSDADARVKEPKEQSREGNDSEEK